MGDTYSTATEAEADRAQQRALLSALGAWDRALRRDECGAWTISGNTGSIHTWGDRRTWVLFVACRSGLHWTYTKRRLSFCTITQDGEDEGCLRLRQLPSVAQATVIRNVLGIRKRVKFDPDELERRRSLMKKLAEAKISGSAGSSVIEPTPEPEPILEPAPAK